MSTTITDLWNHLSTQLAAVESKAADYAPMMITELMKTLSLRQIARRCKRSPTYMSHVLNGKAKCSMATFAKIEELYNAKGEVSR